MAESLGMSMKASLTMNAVAFTHHIEWTEGMTESLGMSMTASLEGIRLNRHNARFRTESSQLPRSIGIHDCWG
jgi:hypothetical protein